MKFRAGVAGALLAGSPFTDGRRTSSTLKGLFKATSTGCCADGEDCKTTLKTLVKGMSGAGRLAALPSLMEPSLCSKLQVSPYLCCKTRQLNAKGIGRGCYVVHER